MATVVCEKFVKTHRTVEKIERIASAPAATHFSSEREEAITPAMYSFYYTLYMIVKIY